MRYVTSVVLGTVLAASTAWSGEPAAQADGLRPPILVHAAIRSQNTFDVIETKESLLNAT
jgi:hypothetical protein